MRSVIRVLVVACLTVAGAATAQPVNDDCADATAIAALPFSETVDTTMATGEPGDPDCLAAGDHGNSIWYRYTATDDVLLTVLTDDSDYVAAAHVLLGACGAPVVVNCDDGVGFIGPLGVTAPVRAGATVLIAVTDADDAGGGAAIVHVSATPIADGTPLHTGGDFQVNVQTSFYQRRPSVAAAAGGDFVVVWSDDYDDDGYGVFARRFDATGTPLGGDVQVNVHTADDQDDAAVAMAPDGDFVVVWNSSFQVDEGDVFARRHDASGTPQGGEIQVNQFTTGQQRRPAVGVDASGGFVVVWQSEQDGSDYGVFARRFDPSGAPLAGEMQVNTYTTFSQGYPAVAVDPSGAFVVVWESPQDGSGSGVVARSFDASGAPLGGEVQVNVNLPGSQRSGAVAADPAGGFLVAWEDGDDRSVKVRRLSAAGAPVGGELVVSESDSGYRFDPAIAADEHGDFVVVWTEDYTDSVIDPSNEGVVGRRVTGSGALVGHEFQVNTYVPGPQQAAAVAFAPGGRFVVVWEDATEYPGRDGSGAGIFAHRFEVLELEGGCPSAPRTGCRQPTLAAKARISIKDKSPDTGDSLGWKWIKGEAIVLAELGDPLTTDEHAFCLYDGTATLIAAATVPPGGTCGARPCWKAVGAKGFKYVDKLGSAGGVRKLVLEAGDDGKARAIAKGKGDNLAVPALPLTAPVTAQLVSTTGTCWETRFEAGGITRNTPTVFAAKAAAGSPSGAFVD